MSRPIQVKYEDEYYVGDCKVDENEKKPKRGDDLVRQRRKTDAVARHKTHIWTEEETYQFYQALKTCGTDFERIQKKLGNNFTRRDVSVKFKRESRENNGMVLSAMGGKTNVRLSGIISRAKTYQITCSQTSTCRVTPISSKNVSEQESNSTVYENIPLND